MDEDEWPSQYTNRLIKRVNKLILDEAKKIQTVGVFTAEQKPVKKKPKGMKSIVEIAESLDAMRNKE